MDISRISWLLVAFIGVVFIGPQGARAQNGPRDFFAAAPAVLFYTDDEMSEEDKTAVVKSGFRKSKKFDCTRWGVATETESSLVLQYCEDSSVTVKSYRIPGRRDESVVAVQSSRASGRATDLSIFAFRKGQREFQPLSKGELEKLGIEQLTENDFLEPSQRFPANEAQPVNLELSEEGDLQGRLVTWMDPRWEHRSEAFSVKFVWGEGRFAKVLKKLG